jgi:diguanylate cyclase (GGDEF)-like protein
VQQILRSLSLQKDDPDLLKAQLAVFSRQIPLLYSTLLVNFVAVAATHYPVTPAWLSVYVPAVLCAICIGRVLMWWRTRVEEFNEEAAYRRVRSVVVLAVVLGTCFVAWSFALFPYGDAYQQGHVAFFMAITVIGCIFCLMHVRLAAFCLTAIVVLPFAVFFASRGNPVFLALAINLVFVALAMTIILLTNYRTFAAMVTSRRELIAKQEETQRLSDENLRLANMDSLTDLPNRRQFFARLNDQFAEARSQPNAFAIGLIDLDGFKPVNDLFGHAVGDKVLVQVGRRLAVLAGEDAFIARLGGDEFGVILKGEVSEARLARFGDAVCQSLELSYEMPEATAKLSSSIGFAVYPGGDFDPEQLMEHADYALYNAKTNNRGQSIVFSQGLATELRNINLIEQELRGSVLERDLSVVYQPIVDVMANRIVAFEALARWSTPALGSVPPDVFIKVAERTDMINKLTATLLRKSLAAAAGWPENVGISFNLSIRDISSKASLLRIVSIIESSGVATSRITLEITETALMRDFEQAAEVLAMLKRIGVRIALDDFGTGYSSLGYVHRLPLDKIKIDRSFVANIQSDMVSQSIVKTVMDLCGNLGLGCIVEGMESQEQVDVLRSFGCRTMQGYFFGKPMSALAASSMLGEEYEKARA